MIYFQVEDLQFYPQTVGSGQYIVILPQILLHWFNIALNELALPLNVVEPLESIWNWKRFEDFEAQYEALKDSKVGSIALGTFYLGIATKISSGFVKLVPNMKVVTEKKHWLPKSGEVSSIPDSIETEELGIIPKKDFFKYSFRCAKGNPSVESRVCREATDGGLPWLIVKQDKHSVTETCLSKEKIIDMYDKFKKRSQIFESQYRILYIVVTSRPVKTEDIDALANSYNDIGVLAKDQLEEYVSLSLGSYIVFNDEQ